MHSCQFYGFENKVMSDNEPVIFIIPQERLIYNGNIA